MASGSEKSPPKELDSQGRKSAEEEIYWQHMKNVRFLVVLTGDFQQKLSIPKKFAENMRAIILNPKITLHGPSGISWNVALAVGADGLFLQEGWEEFVAAHSLQENDTLIFKYDRKASFHVKIFNGECEKEASYFVKKCGHVIQAMEYQKEGDSSEIVEEADGDDEDEDEDEEAVVTPSKEAEMLVGTETDERQEGHDRTETHMMTLRKRKPVQWTDEMQEEYDRTETCINLRKRKPVQWTVDVLRKKMLRSFKKPPEPVSNAEPEGAEESNQDNPANKDVPPQDQNTPETNGNDPGSNVDKGISVTRRRPRKCAASVKRFTSPAVPEGAEEPPNQDSSARKDMPSQDQNTRETNRNDPESSFDLGLFMTRSKQRKWTASEKKLTSPAGPGGVEDPNQDSTPRKDVPSQDQNAPEMNGNDPESNLDKALSMTRGGSRKFPSSVKRFSSPVECYISNRRPVTEEEKNEALRLALENLTEESFIAIMRNTSCYKGFSMSIPSKWSQDFLGPKNQAVILRMGKKTWTTRYCFSRSALGTGWKQFALENNLEEFDTCLFKLVSPDYAEVMLDVTIYRVVEDVTPPTRL